jgi:hypothetical protein
LPDGAADVELAGRLAAGIVPRRLLGNGQEARDTTMIEIPKMSCKASHDIFEKLYHRSIPRLHHASQAPGNAPLLLLHSYLLREMSAASQAYIV